jgi:RimJ/RimL family protein N-acetyltransferase
MSPARTPTFRLSKPISTERLVLRPYEAGDLDALADLQARHDVTRYLYWSPRSRDEAAQSLEKKLASTRLASEGDVLSLAVTRRAGGPLIGDLTLVYRSVTHRQAEIGYLFHPDVQGQGLATEAARVLLTLAFEEMRCHRVMAQLDARNRASAALLERLGMRREAHLVENEWVKGEWTDEVIYGLLATEWAAQTRPV